MLSRIGPLELVVILVIVLLLFGPSKLPQLAKGLGESIKEFKKAAKSENEKSEIKKADDTKNEGGNSPDSASKSA